MKYLLLFLFWVLCGTTFAGSETAGPWVFKSGANTVTISGSSVTITSGTASITLSGTTSFGGAENPFAAAMNQGVGTTDHVIFSDIHSTGDITADGVLAANVVIDDGLSGYAGAISATTTVNGIPLSGLAKSIVRVSGTLVSGTASISNANISGLNCWAQDNASSITNVGALTVSVSGTTANIKSSVGVLDTSPFSLFIAP